MAIELKLRF